MVTSLTPLTQFLDSLTKEQIELLRLALAAAGYKSVSFLERYKG